MSGQNTLITCANDNEIKRPSGTLISRQLYRDKSAQGSGVYKAMDENGNIEIIGGPGFEKIFVESGDFIISADGSDIQLNGSSANQTVLFSVNSVVGISLGDTITNIDTGATGKVVQIIPGPKRIKLDSLTAGIWIITNNITNGTVNTTISNSINPIWSFSIPTINKAKLIFLNGLDLNNGLVSCNGIDDSTVKSECSYITVNGGNQESRVIQSNLSMYLREDDNNGWSGHVFSITSNQFIIQMTSFPVSGVASSFRYKTITEQQ